jgi:hypothetical protein
MSDIASYRVAETATQDKKLTKQDQTVFSGISSQCPFPITMRTNHRLCALHDPGA